MRVLFASTRGAGHFGPLVPLAHACQEAGHDVLVAGPPVLQATVEGAGLAFWELADPPAEELDAIWSRVPSLSEREQNRVVIGDIFARLNTAATLPGHRRACREWRPDVVVRESNEYGSALAAELEGVPHAQFGISLGQAEEYSLQFAAPALDEARAAMGLPLDPNADALRAAPYLTWFPRSLEDPAVPARPNTARLADPAWDAPAAPLPAWWPVQIAERPLVYMTFGSVAGSFEQAVPVFGMAMAAVSELPIRVLLTVGRAVERSALPPAPPNVHVEPWVPQSEVLAHAAAVVCHGGAGSTLGALAAGRPLVVAPLFADQPFNAARVAATGAGLSVAPDPQPLRAALERVLDEPEFAAAAEAIAAEMRRHRPALEGVQLLAELAR